MLRITEGIGDAGMARFKVEGRLAGRSVAELEAVCAEAMRAGEPPVIDLAGVSYADAGGAAILARLQEQGAVLLGASAFVLELLEGPRTESVSTADDELSLVERLRRGDGDAYETIVRRFGGRLLATARRMLGNDDDAEDALQEALLSAFRHIDQFAGQARLSTWLHRIVVNVVLMRMRSRKSRPESSIEDLLPRFMEDGHWADRIGGNDESSDVLLERQETRRLVRRCITQLPETYRVVLTLRDLDELDTDETAALLGITPNAVKIRLHRARQALRTLIERALADETPNSAVG
ncbi:MAG TPA: sigma-70 family RNA polymerase sigma factor [Candidatus Dormibacteraeota bacterium]|nr:sigma-70 family RNA polymerase sigma factor [Candidatus Dormibacteraeota bacterium]